MASLKDQLDQAGYDTSTLDEASVLKQLSDAGYDTSSFTPSNQGVMGAVGAAAKSLLPSRETLEAPMKASSKLGTMVEAGGAGIGDLLAHPFNATRDILNSGANALVGGNRPVSETSPVTTASNDVNAVMSGLSPETGAGKAGKFVGSFFTPNQIALTAAGEGIAAPILKGLGKGVNAAGELLAPASEAELPGAEKAVGNLLSTASGVKTPELETVMQAGRQAVQGAKTFPELADSVADSMNALSDHLDTLEKTADAALNAKKTIPMNVLTDSIQDELQALKALPQQTQSAEGAQDVLQKMLDSLKNKKDLTEPEFESYIKKLKVNWDNPSATELGNASKNIYNDANAALKTSNPDYAKAESEFADAVNLKNDLSDAMGVKNIDGKWTPQNVSVAKLKNLVNPDSAIQTKKLLGQFAEVPGVPNYTDLARQAAAKAALEQGWRARLAGLLAGAVPGAGKAVANTLTGGITALPTAANAVYQGLSQ